MIHAHNFTDCVASMMDLSRRRQADNGIRHLAVLIGKVLQDSERFYLPADFQILKPKTEWSSFSDFVRLPFEKISLFKCVTEFGTRDKWITIAMRGEEFLRLAASQGLQLGGEAVDLKSDRDFFVAEALAQNADRDWLAMPALGVCIFESDSPYPRVAAIRAVQHEGLTQDLAFQRAKCMVERVANLCVMLNLANVRSEKRDAPIRLNRKREASGKLPLYSYRVLEVDGEKWEREISPTQSQSNGVRSHMRRGHIRRLDETRRTWVRATMVHGSRPGFVDKEYQVG